MFWILIAYCLFSPSFLPSLALSSFLFFPSFPFPLPSSPPPPPPSLPSPHLPSPLSLSPSLPFPPHHTAPTPSNHPTSNSIVSVLKKKKISLFIKLNKHTHYSLTSQ